MSKVVNIADYKDPLLFSLRDFMLGDKEGQWLVIANSGLPVGRYIDRTAAEEHAANIAETKYEEKVDVSPDALRKLIEKSDQLLAEGEWLIKKMKFQEKKK